MRTLNEGLRKYNEEKRVKKIERDIKEEMRVSGKYNDAEMEFDTHLIDRTLTYYESMRELREILGLNDVFGSGEGEIIRQHEEAVSRIENALKCPLCEDKPKWKTIFDYMSMKRYRVLRCKCREIYRKELMPNQ